MSDTPRTDDGEYFIDGDRGIVDSGLGRRLERELNAAHFIIRQQQLLIEENLGLKERIKRLEEAGDATANLLLKGDLNDHTALLHTYSMWIKTKEAKP